MKLDRGRYQIRYKRRKGFSFERFFNSIVSFIMDRKILFGAIAAGVVVVIVLFVTGVINPTAATMAQNTPPPSVSVDSSQAQASASAAPTPSKSTGPIVGKIIGVSALSLSLEDYQLTGYFDKEANEDIKSKQLQSFIFSNAKGDGSKQLADVQDMIKKGANVIVVMGTSGADFAKISQVCAQNKVQIVASNVDATQGFAVDVMSQANHAQKFAQFAKQNGAAQIYTVGADTTEVQTIDPVVPVISNIASAGASKNISDRLNNNTPVWNLMFFDNSANAVLKMYVKKGAIPNTISTPAYVGFIKTWYALMHDGINSATGDPVKAAASPSPAASASAKVSAPASASAPAATGVTKADPSKFHAIAYTKVQNLGEIVYQFALNLSAGRTLQKPNYIFDMAGEEYITNDNIDSYYAKIGKLTDQDILPSIGDASTVDALFQ